MFLAPLKRWLSAHPRRSERLLALGFGALLIGIALCFFPYFIVADASFHLLRLESLALHLADGGGYPCRLYAHAVNGYGYAAPMFYCDLLMVPFALLRVIGFSKSICFVAWVLSVFALGGGLMFWSAKWFGFTRKQAGLAALLFTLSPVLQSALLVPCALGGATAAAFLPCLFFGLCELSTRADQSSERLPQAAAWLILGGCGVFLSHTISMALSGLVFGLWTLLRIGFLLRHPRNLLALGVAGAAVLALTAWYWLPLLEQAQQADLVVFSTDRRLHLEDTISNFPITCLFLPLWTLSAFKKYIPEWFHYSPAGCSLLGWVFLPLCLAWSRQRRALAWESWCKLAIAMLYGLLILMTCKPLARLLDGPLGWIQFPARFAPFWWVIAIALAIHHLPKFTPRARTLVLYGFLIAASLAFIRPVLLRGFVWISRGGDYPTPNTLTLNLGAGEFLPRRWATHVKHGEAYANPMSDLAGRVFAITAKLAPPQTRCTVPEGAPPEVVFPLFYYPGYQGYFKGKPCSVSENPEGWLTVHLPDATGGTVEVRYEGTPLQAFADRLSLCALLGFSLLGLLLYLRRKRGQAPAAPC